jgi:hypothetical protein
MPRAVVPHGFGPHHIISTGEIVGTIVVLVLAFIALAALAYETRNPANGPFYP